MRPLSYCHPAVFGWVCLCLGWVCLCFGCDSARSARDAEEPAPAVSRTQHSQLAEQPAEQLTEQPAAQPAARTEASGGAPAAAASPSQVKPIALQENQASELELVGPGSAVLVVHVQVNQPEAWDSFSVRVSDSAETTLGAFVVPYGSKDAAFTLRVASSKLAGLKAQESAKVRVLPKLVQAGGAFPRTAQLWAVFSSQP